MHPFGRKLQLTFCLMKSPATYIFLGFGAAASVLLSGCTVPTSGSVSITKVNPYHLHDGEAGGSSDDMLSFDKDRLLHGAVEAEEVEDRFGHYFTIFWNTKNKVPATVRLEYRQALTGGAVRYLDNPVAEPKGRNVTKFEITGEDYRVNGKVTQWRVLILEGGSPVAEYKSFLWQ
jgi:hypothetical protein